MLYGERVKYYREARDLTQDELARLAGISSTALSRIEKGARRLTLEEAVHIAAALRVPLPALAGLESLPIVRPSVGLTSKNLRALADELDLLVAG